MKLVSADMCAPNIHHFYVFKQKTAYELRISDWSSDVCSSDLRWWRRCRVTRLGPDGADLQRRSAGRLAAGGRGAACGTGGGLSPAYSDRPVGGRGRVAGRRFGGTPGGTVPAGGGPGGTGATGGRGALRHRRRGPAERARRPAERKSKRPNSSH